MSAVKYVGGILASKPHTDCNSFLIYEHTNILFDNITAEIFCTNTSKQLNTKLYSISTYRSEQPYPFILFQTNSFFLYFNYHHCCCNCTEYCIEQNNSGLIIKLEHVMLKCNLLPLNTLVSSRKI